MVKVAVDAMGGDYAPRAVVDGVIEAIKSYSVHITLVGDQPSIQGCLDRHNLNSDELSRLTIHHSTEVVGMAESPSGAFKKKKNSSIRVGIDMIKKNQVDGFVSAGNTGAVMTTSTLVLGRINGIERPAIASVFPSLNGQFLLLDIGSTVDSKPSHLLQFAVMGHWYSKLVLNVDTPKIGLLNIGEEDGKGNRLTQSVLPLLKNAPIHFIGNVEAKELLFDRADVVVCDGFLGNNLLKFGEGIVSFLITIIKQECQRSFIAKIGAYLMSSALRNVRKMIDYEEYGGAVLLGVNGVSVVCHGRSHAKAIKHGVRCAIDAIDNHMIQKIEHSVSAELSYQHSGQ